jgi:hypothetical protein
MMLSRRDAIKVLFLACAGVVTPYTGMQSETRDSIETILSKEFDRLPSAEYRDVSHTTIDWTSIGKGLEFARVEVHRGTDLVDIIAAVKIGPKYNRIRVFNSFGFDKTKLRTIEGWRDHTGATVMVNSAQYTSSPGYAPCALVIADDVQKGPQYNKSAKGMLVAEPKQPGLPQASLLDFDYDAFDCRNTRYTQGVQHWPILLDRQGRTKVNPTQWQANRTVVAKDFEGNIMFFTTEGGFFTLYNLGRFLKESNKRKDSGFRVHTAMNMDGGYEACMAIKSPSLQYVTYGEFETYGPDKDATIRDIRIKIPGVIGVFPR